MSSIPTKQIDGDVAVGRNVSVGGKATVRGSATIGHNLKVEGWLDAPNIKGPNKGLFKTAVQLREAFPNPHEGWWALVGDTLPAQVYMADGGAWVAQTNADGTPKLAGNPTVDSSEYMEAVEEMTGDLEAVKIEVNQIRKTSAAYAPAKRRRATSSTIYKKPLKPHRHRPTKACRMPRQRSQALTLSIATRAKLTVLLRSMLTPKSPQHIFPVMSMM